MAHSTHSTQPALRPHRTTPRAEDTPPQTRRPHSNGRSLAEGVLLYADARRFVDHPSLRESKEVARERYLRSALGAIPVTVAHPVALGVADAPIAVAVLVVPGNESARQPVAMATAVAVYI